MMGKREFLLLFFGLIFLLTGCSKNEETDRGYPRLNTMEVTDINNNGAVFNAEIISGSQYEILNYGFAWSETKDPDLLNTDRIVFTGDIKSKMFSADILTTLGVGVKYYVRSFVMTNNFTVYGKNVEFVSDGSQAPEITSFSPSSGTSGDVLKIYGKGFSYIKSKNVVTLGLTNCDVITSTDTLLTVLVPIKKDILPVKISVSILGNKAVSEGNFVYITP
jgi:hypothetical protein